MRVAWLAESATWGPLTRAVGVLGIGTDVQGVVLGQRTAIENEPLVYEGVPFVTAECCTAGEQMPDVLAATDADVIVADSCWGQVAADDGRPCLVMGLHGAGLWDLDAMPVHPWAWRTLPTRGDVRERWGVPVGNVVVGVMSPATMGHLFENQVRDVVPDHVLLVSLTGWRAAEQMVGCDLVVCSAGWAPAHEAAWSGVPYCAIATGPPDQQARATHTYGDARMAVRCVRSAGLPPSHRPLAPDHVAEFVTVLDLLAEGVLL